MDERQVAGRGMQVAARTRDGWLDEGHRSWRGRRRSRRATVIQVHCTNSVQGTQVAVDEGWLRLAGRVAVDERRVPGQGQWTAGNGWTRATSACDRIVCDSCYHECVCNVFVYPGGS